MDGSEGAAPAALMQLQPPLAVVVCLSGGQLAAGPAATFTAQRRHQNAGVTETLHDLRDVCRRL